jgi:hypothetical protein
MPDRRRCLPQPCSRKRDAFHVVCIGRSQGNCGIRSVPDTGHSNPPHGVSLNDHVVPFLNDESVARSHTVFLFTHHHSEKGPRLEFRDAFSEVVVAFAKMAAGGGSEDETVVRLWDADEQGKLLFPAQHCFKRQTIFVAVDDNEVHDGARKGFVSHTILSSTDVDYSKAQVSAWPGREVLILIGDK